MDIINMTPDQIREMVFGASKIVMVLQEVPEPEPTIIIEEVD